MRDLISLAFLIPLAGCVAPMASTPIEIANPTLYQADVEECRTAAANYSPVVSASSIALGALSGAIGTVAYTPINPLIPGLGAAGGAANAAVAPFDLTGSIRANVYRHCLIDRTSRDHAAIIANPDQ